MWLLAVVTTATLAVVTTGDWLPAVTAVPRVPAREGLAVLAFALSFQAIIVRSAGTAVINGASFEEAIQERALAVTSVVAGIVATCAGLWIAVDAVLGSGAGGSRVATVLLSVSLAQVNAFLGGLSQVLWLDSGGQRVPDSLARHERVITRYRQWLVDERLAWLNGGIPVGEPAWRRHVAARLWPLLLPLVLVAAGVGVMLSAAAVGVAVLAGSPVGENAASAAVGMMLALVVLLALGALLGGCLAVPRSWIVVTIGSVSALLWAWLSVLAVLAEPAKAAVRLLPSVGVLALVLVPLVVRRRGGPRWLARFSRADQWQGQRLAVAGMLLVSSSGSLTSTKRERRARRSRSAAG
ncbi:hypothetical protein [Cellulomonas fimi]|uniref:hypothetical protein n=1 Tax=Cellulomonas fimi TaxID=1708 RepID=UPI0005A1C981|nr:hypothetical protein [Cellulomonas fimi]NNH08011.1 hypothetical protein [Cellulomonas fimi]VEH28754.1 Uncharacterised protein [Cellulomonas fimi]